MPTPAGGVVGCATDGTAVGCSPCRRPGSGCRPSGVLPGGTAGAKAVATAVGTSHPFLFLCDRAASSGAGGCAVGAATSDGGVAFAWDTMPGGGVANLAAATISGLEAIAVGVTRVELLSPQVPRPPSFGACRTRSRCTGPVPESHVLRSRRRLPSCRSQRSLSSRRVSQGPGIAAGVPVLSILVGSAVGVGWAVAIAGVGLDGTQRRLLQERFSPSPCRL